MDIQRELPLGLVMDVAYVGKKGSHLESSRNLNQPNNGVKPYPLFGPISWFEPRASSIYHGLQSRVERRSGAGLNLLVSYSWSKLIDDTTDAVAGRDSYNLKIERGLGQEDMRHRMSASAVYELPLGRGKTFLSNLNGVGQAILGGWELATIVRVNSGVPLTPTLSIDNSGLGDFRDRPDIIGNPKLDKPNPKTGWWNKAAFQIPPKGSIGNAGKGSLIGPGYAGTDSSALKHFSVGEAKDLQLRLEVFNLFNHANFYPVDSLQFDSATFGTISFALPNRQIQLGLKYIF